MIRSIKKYVINFFILLILSSCSSTLSNTKDSCSIFSERYLWYKHAKKNKLGIWQGTFQNPEEWRKKN